MDFIILSTALCWLKSTQFPVVGQAQPAGMPLYLEVFLVKGSDMKPCFHRCPSESSRSVFRDGKFLLIFTSQLSLDLFCECPWFTSIQEHGCDKGAHQSHLRTERNTHVIPNWFLREKALKDKNFKLVILSWLRSEAIHILAGTLHTAWLTLCYKQILPPKDYFLISHITACKDRLKRWFTKKAKEN